MNDAHGYGAPGGCIILAPIFLVAMAIVMVVWKLLKR